MGRENVLTYGKITIISSGEGVDILMEHLDSILSKHGYPFDKPKDTEDSEEEDFEDIPENIEKLEENIEEEKLEEPEKPLENPSAEKFNEMFKKNE